jgi:uncharacterized peroxidase-related enzyme
MAAVERAPALADQEWGECLVPAEPVPAAMEAEVRRRIGVLPGWLPRVARSPWIVQTFCDLIDKPVAYAPVALCDLVALVVSQDNSCRYCYGVQRAILKIYGYRETYIDQLVGDLHAAELSPAERAALEFARQVSRAQPRPGRRELDALVQAGVSAQATVEITAIASAGTFSNRVSTLLALPFEALESAVNHPLFRFIRPLMAWRMREKPKSPVAPPQPNDGPYARLVTALGSSPAAWVIRRAVDGALASPVLPRRTKSLLLAVIARALGCAYGEAEARRLLAQEPGAALDIDDILRHLGGSGLDAREALLVPFARETVRYQPAAIQRRMRELAGALSPDELVEMVGVVSLANAVCRLSITLDAC